MKKKLLFIIPAIALTGFTIFQHDLIGTWQSNAPGGSKVTLEFKADGKFMVTVDGAEENKGTYTFKQDTFTMYDDNCGMQAPGRYKINFFTVDSAAFSLISDPCTDRSGEVAGGTIKRIKAQK
jgi:hypothetical protein